LFNKELASDYQGDSNITVLSRTTPETRFEKEAFFMETQSGPGELPTPLFVLEMANNHMGDVSHGLRIIEECADALAGLPYHFAVKLQYRHLDTFIHPNFQNRLDLKYVKRFQETRLTETDYLCLKESIVSHGFLSACTPFDERSVDLLETHGFDILKVASCSFTDWPLLERISLTAGPIVASTAGATLEDIDKVVNFFLHRNRSLSLMHCVAEYPTPIDKLRLGQIDVLRKRYPDLNIGFSTHEPPNALEPIRLAVSKGATVFEKHVGVPTSKYSLNNYSATPREVGLWVRAAASTWEICGSTQQRDLGSEQEVASLRALSRGAYAKQAMSSGQRIEPAAVFFSMPVQPGQLSANDFSKYADVTAEQPLISDGALTIENVAITNNREQIYEIARSVRTLLNKSGAVVPRRADLEISHHYGIENFYQTGLTMITVVNREYCKKLIVLLPGQQHPEQYHKLKEETFHVLYGTVEVTLNGESHTYSSGDVVTVAREVKHTFRTQNGVVIEEVSSSHSSSDSYYTDPVIAQNKNRKTFVTYSFDGSFY
tara:strand:+ start:1024 stop:2658 length:1635 start_codon:yes stop_codon:yes gene_type:complete